ncbi:hypothetical protein BU26DRAFT_514183 [Trematosphaeria pertusa]|uniref:Uncharacterized protein n=1 Tax=Trematosphaeria pertusa TaxID=390896 RepID=A0A6A6IUG1_9PLEO|nr:uncharacterized protein BU26DRAFT_514183 [Trematosphaeria pertusa]KAF2254191.1 hypothetical protein BU26DRAFT_514183 [Trematosphaeria pertusa]
MSLYKFFPTTPHLNELIAALVLDGKTQIQTEEESTTLFRYGFSKDCRLIAAEVYKRIDEIKAAVTWATVEIPKKEPAALLLTSGRLTSNLLRVVVPLKSAEALMGTKLQLWKGECYEEVPLELGMTLIFEGVQSTPHDVPFLVVPFRTSAR